MSFLLEYRKVNDINIPLHFKFSTIIAKDNLTADKLLTLENWLKIFDELNPLLASDPSTSRKGKTFELDNGRLSVKARWAKINDSSDMGAYIVKILNLSAVGKYFLKIDVKLSSYLERIASEWEQKNKFVDVKSNSKEASHDVPNSSKHKKSNNRKMSDMLPKVETNQSKIKTEKDDPPALLEEVANSSVLDDLIEDDLNKVEEYIPLPKPTLDTTLTTTDTIPTYKPEKCTPTEMNAFHSEYSPLQADKSTDEGVSYHPTPGIPSPTTATYNPEKKLSQIELNKMESEYSPTGLGDKPIKEELVYKPTTKRNKSSDNERTKKILNKSKELFGSSDENSDDKIDKVSSSSQKRKMDSSPRRERTSSRGREKEKSKSKKKKLHDDQSSQESMSEVGDISMRNLMTESVDGILATYAEHEQYLTKLYENHVKHLKRNYKPIDIPDMAALDIVSSPQFSAMINFLEDKLVRNAEEEHNYSDILFDLLIPEWALAIFCSKYHCSRLEALERLHLQSVALINSSDL